MPYVRVALDLPLATLFDYAVDESMKVAVGQCVRVPFSRKLMVGVVLECATDTTVAAQHIRPVERVLAEVPALPEELLTLLRFCSDYYHFPLGATVLSALPARLRSGQPVKLKQELQYRLSASGQALDLAQLPKRQRVQQRILVHCSTAH